MEIVGFSHDVAHLFDTFCAFTRWFCKRIGPSSLLQIKMVTKTKPVDEGLDNNSEL